MVTNIRFFDSIEEMVSAIEQAREEADKRIRPWQEQVKPGDYFIRCEPDITIYGQVLEPDEEDRGLYQAPHMRGYRFTRCYSETCPEGEYGDTHVSCIDRLITASQFEWMREWDWPYMTLDMWDWLVAQERKEQIE